MEQQQPEQVMSEITTILMNKYGCSSDEVTREASLYNDLGMDSLDALEFSMELETHFGVKIDDDRIPEMENLGKIVDYVNQLIEDKRPYGAGIGRED